MGGPFYLKPFRGYMAQNRRYIPFYRGYIARDFIFKILFLRKTPHPIKNPPQFLPQTFTTPNHLQPK